MKFSKSPVWVVSVLSTAALLASCSSSSERRYSDRDRDELRAERSQIAARRQAQRRQLQQPGIAAQPRAETPSRQASSEEEIIQRLMRAGVPVNYCSCSLQPQPATSTPAPVTPAP